MSFRYNPFTGSLDVAGSSSGGGGAPSWKASVTNFGDLPAAGNSVGDVRLVTSLNRAYTWNGSLWKLISDVYKVERKTLAGGDIINKYIVLEQVPTTSASTRLMPINGIEQDYGTDFEITADDGGKRLSWSGLGLDGTLQAGDKIIIAYN